MMGPRQVHPGRAVRLRRLVLRKAVLRRSPVVLPGATNKKTLCAPHADNRGERRLGEGRSAMSGARRTPLPLPLLRGRPCLKTAGHGDAHGAAPAACEDGPEPPLSGGGGLCLKPAAGQPTDTRRVVEPETAFVPPEGRARTPEGQKALLAQ